MTTGRLGLRVPRHESMPRTMEAASAPLTKNSATKMMTTMDVTVNSGSSVRVANSPASGPSATASLIVVLPPSSRLRAVPPSTEYQMKLTRLGARMTPRTNSRIVRPREMRAMNDPTKGDREIHQAQ